MGILIVALICHIDRWVHHVILLIALAWAAIVMSESVLRWGMFDVEFIRPKADSMDGGFLADSCACATPPCAVSWQIASYPQFLLIVIFLGSYCAADIFAKRAC